MILLYLFFPVPSVQPVNLAIMLYSQAPLSQISTLCCFLQWILSALLTKKSLPHTLKHNPHFPQIEKIGYPLEESVLL